MTEVVRNESSIVQGEIKKKIEIITMIVIVIKSVLGVGVKAGKSFYFYILYFFYSFFIVLRDLHTVNMVY